MKAIERPQHFFNYKLMGFFPDAQGKLTPQSVVGSGRISDSSRVYDCFRYLQEWGDSIENAGACVTNRVFRRCSAGQIVVSGGIWSKFEHIQAFKHVIVTCKNKLEKIQSKMKALQWPHHYIKSMGIFRDVQGSVVAPQSVVETGRISNSSETLWLSSSPAIMQKIQSKLKALEWPQDYIW